ncbi:MAG: winged helix-turn-helix domain-containing protein [Acidobacteriota bacterium]
MTERRLDACYAFGDFHLDLEEQTLQRAGRPVGLTPKALATLGVLIERCPRVVTKDELIDAVWAGAFVTEATLTQNIYTLRKVFEGSEAEDWIETVPRRGYRFLGAVRQVRCARATVGEPDREPVGGNTFADTFRSLAVLPLRCLTTADDDDRFLGLALADALITSLSGLPSLSVRATRSILRFVDDEASDPVAVGRELRVDGILDGSIQRLGSRIRVTLQLISVARGVPCWAESVQGAYDDIFEAQDAIAAELVARLAVGLSGSERLRLGERPTRSLEAHRAYVRGRYAWNRRTAGDLQRAIGLFREAIEIDPDYALAHAGLADALILLPFYGAARPEAAFRQARDAARSALALEPSLAEAHTSLAYTDFVVRHDWARAENGFQRALEHAPDYATAHHWYAFLLTALGRHDEALERGRRALEIEPLSLVIAVDVALADYFARRPERALEQLEAVADVAPDFGYARLAFALCWSALERPGRAIASAQRAASSLPESGAAQAVLGYCLARGDEASRARDVLAEMDQRPFAQASHRALVLAGLGETEQALAALADGLRERSRFVAFLGVWPVFDPLRNEAGFAALLSELGLGELGLGDRAALAAR